MSNPAKCVRLSVAQAKQIMFDAWDNDSYSSDSDSGIDYYDHVSQPSEQSDEESADASTVVRQLIALSLLQLMSPGQIASQIIEVEIRLEVGSGGRGRGLAQSTSPVVEIGPTDSSLYEKMRQNLNHHHQ